MESPAFMHGSFCRTDCGQAVMEKRQNEPKGSDYFTIDDLLDLPNDDECMVTEPLSIAGNSTDCSTITFAESSNSSFSGTEIPSLSNTCRQSVLDSQLSGDLCVPLDDLEELEWLSNFVEDSFSSEDSQKFSQISGMKIPREIKTETRDFCGDTCQTFPSEMSVRGKARSKRSRALSCKWSSCLMVRSPTTSSSEECEPLPKVAKDMSIVRRKDITDASAAALGRRCMHCATEQTPQWRTGPMGPKTLCNACGVRYKSGRLVPEYRPAASPTFVLTKHSNSHRKVMELRRQKELQLLQQQEYLHPNPVFDVVSSSGDDYFICHA